MPSVGVWQDSPPHGSGTDDPAALGGSLLRRQQGKREPQGYATVPLPDHRYLIIIGRHWDFLKLIPWEYVRVCAGVLSPGTSPHNGTVDRADAMHGRSSVLCGQPLEAAGPVHGWSVSSRKAGGSAGFLPSIDLSDKNA